MASIDPVAYAQTRNALEGAVTRLSPHITHGFLSLRDVLRAIHDRHPLTPSHKLVFELAWRAYFQHVWEHEGDGIFESLHEGPLPDGVYASSLPLDIRQARTGVPAIDLAVRILYSTGYLHNHARMWLASYIIHVRRIHWKVGADWLYGHLLDGDLASNHLSWQWVAGTGSSKPYVFNADNVAKFAPVDWHSFNSSIDVSYETMDMIAHGEKKLLLHLSWSVLRNPPCIASSLKSFLNVLSPILSQAVACMSFTPGHWVIPLVRFVAAMDQRSSQLRCFRRRRPSACRGASCAGVSSRKAWRHARLISG